jgi:hypothetical protein
VYTSRKRFDAKSSKWVELQPYASVKGFAYAYQTWIDTPDADQVTRRHHQTPHGGQAAGWLFFLSSIARQPVAGDLSSWPCAGEETVAGGRLLRDEIVQVVVGGVWGAGQQACISG